MGWRARHRTDPITAVLVAGQLDLYYNEKIKFESDIIYATAQSASWMAWMPSATGSVAITRDAYLAEANIALATINAQIIALGGTV